jgi:CRP-like cAMP-binding protein
MDRAPPKDLVKELGAMVMFAGFGRRELRTLVRLGEERRFKAKERLVAQDEREAAFHVILDGKVELRRGGRPISELGRGDFFGGPVLLGGWLYPPEVVALEDTRCFVMTMWAFQGLTRLHPNLLTRIRWQLTSRKGSLDLDQNADYYADH